MCTVPSVEPAEVESYARAAAAMVGITIDDDWWPGVVRHLTVMLDRAASVEAVGPEGRMPADPAPVFRA